MFLLELVADVTEQERLRARLTEAERLAAVGELAASVAHEIRNPLAAIVNAATLSRTGGDAHPGGADGTLDAVKKETRRLNGILSDFLVFARPRESKRLKGDIRQVVDHVAALVRENPVGRGGRAARRRGWIPPCRPSRSTPTSSRRCSGTSPSTGCRRWTAAASCAST